MKRTLAHTIALLPALVVSFGALLAHAGEFASILEIPGTDIGSMSGEELIQMLYILAISFAALVAVVQLVIAGFQYITSEVITSKEAAKKRLWAAVIGLLIILAAVALLRAINPGIANLPALTAPPEIQLPDMHAEPVSPNRPTECPVVDLACHTRCSDAGGILQPPEEGSNTRSCTYPSDDPNDDGVSPSDIPPCTATDITELGNCRRVCVEQGFGIHKEGRLGTPNGVTITCVGDDATNVQPPDGLPSDAESFMVDGTIYYTDFFDDDRSTNALYCEPDNTACNDYCFANDGIMDEESGVCMVPISPLDIDVSG